MSLIGFCRWLPVLLFVWLGSGCAVWQKAAPPPASDWKTVTGLVRYQDTRRTVVADVTIREKSPRDYSMEVSKAGAVLLKLDRAADRGWASGVMAFFPWSGSVNNAPSHLKNWFIATTDALENPASPTAPTSTSPGIQYRLQR